MQRPPQAIAARRSPAFPALRALVSAALGFMLTASAGSAGTVGLSSQPVRTRGEEARGLRTTDKAAHENPRRSPPRLTVILPLRDEAPVRVDTPRARVRIERAEGNDVAVVVEKRTVEADSSCELRPTDLVTIELARDAKSVRLRATARASRRATPSERSSFLVLPERAGAEDGPDFLDRLTGLLWRALGREALRWLTH